MTVPIADQRMALVLIIRFTDAALQFRSMQYYYDKCLVSPNRTFEDEEAVARLVSYACGDTRELAAFVRDASIPRRVHLHLMATDVCDCSLKQCQACKNKTSSVKHARRDRATSDMFRKM